MTRFAAGMMALLGGVLLTPAVLEADFGRFVEGDYPDLRAGDRVTISIELTSGESTVIGFPATEDTLDDFWSPPTPQKG